MTVGELILKTARSRESLYPSPPPELEEGEKKAKKVKKVFKPPIGQARVCTSPPPYMLTQPARLPGWTHQAIRIFKENVTLLQNIRYWQLRRGKVDCRWDRPPRPIVTYYQTRVDRLARIQRDNQDIHKLITQAEARIPTTKVLREDWVRNRDMMVHGARGKFVLFPPVALEVMEDDAFAAPEGVTRPRVYLTLRIKNCAPIGELAIELFTDCCPDNCRLFTELADGDGLGHGYVGTSFYRKVPHLYWSGGDVICDNGFGCYAQKGRRAPIGADNYHYSHSMPGLVSMRVTPDDEMCGSFNITFKPIPQFDLKNVVVGRVIPCPVFDSIRELGSPLSPSPVVQVAAARRRGGRGWVTGRPNTRLVVGRPKMHK